MTKVYDDAALRRLIEEQSQRMAEYQAKMTTINARLQETLSRPALPDPILVAGLRAEFDRMSAEAREYAEEMNRRARMLRQMIGPNLPSA